MTEAEAGDNNFCQEREDRATELPSAMESRRTRSNSLRPRPDRNIFFSPGTFEPASPAGGDGELMGPIMRRKRMYSMPLGMDPRQSEFFGGSRGSLAFPNAHMASGAFQSGYATPPGQTRIRQHSGGAVPGTVGMPRTSPKPTRRRQSSLIQGILGRKGVALDLAAPEDVDFFAPLVPEEQEPEPSVPTAPEESEATGAIETGEGEEVKPQIPVTEEAEKKLFKPLRFSKPLKLTGKGGSGGSGGLGGGGGVAVVDEEIHELLELQFESQQKVGKLLSKISECQGSEFERLLSEIKAAAKEVDGDTEKLQSALGVEKIPVDEGEEMRPCEGVDQDIQSVVEKERKLALIEVDPSIKKATRSDFIYTSVLIAIMFALTGVILGWHTEVDEEFSVFGPVGLACSSPCLGHLETQNYFRAHAYFETGNIVSTKLRLDPNPDITAHALIQIVGAETGQTKATQEVGPADPGKHMMYESDIDVHWDQPHEEHIINVFSINEGQHLKELKCTTPCNGNLTSQNYFDGESAFNTGDYLQLVMQLSPSNHDDTLVNVQIIGMNSKLVKQEVTFGPARRHGPEFFTRTIEVGFDIPGEEHVINVFSTNEDDSVAFTLSAYSNNNTVLSFTLYATQLNPIAKYSELIAALIMIFVYLFILLEWIHRTLVAIGGSMIALFFFFLMHNGETESIQTLMLNMEWSTLGLLFGMMTIVGELSHTGVFEWLSVRLLVASKGSYIRLMALLCFLTAVSSAFLDNVTTMLLIAPVTIDMCSILDVDPRPYLIGEVLLSNVGGTSTLIGDPPNIIIGSAFDEIGFVDFIIEVAPMIFFFGIPVSIALVSYLYRYYLITTKMPYLDVNKLKHTYQIYDEPRLLIAGTVAFFVILIFFLHPVHHKDTAWIALLGAFITIGFTNPHDVQDALRNHIEWDTLLFFAGLFVLVEICAHLGLLELIGEALADYIKEQPKEDQLVTAITLLLWVSAMTSAFLDNIPYTATMIPVVRILAEELPDTLPIKTLAWALSFGACLGGNGTLLGASANIVTAGISTTRGFEISFLNFFYPGMVVMIATVAIANLYMVCIYVWI